MDYEQAFLFIIEVIGTVAFAISGIRMAAAKNFDWFGAYTVGLVTAIGGGTLRDILLDIPVFWMQTWWYLAVTAMSLIVVIDAYSCIHAYYSYSTPSGWPCL